jgi:hypothetical protein
LLSARPTMRPTQPLAQPAPLASVCPQAKIPPRRPIQHMRRWRLYGSTLSILVRAFQAGRFSLVSLSNGPRLSALSLTSDRPSSAEPPLPHGHPAPQVPPSSYYPAIISPLNSPLKPLPPSSMALKPLMSALTPATPPRCSPDPYKRVSTTPALFTPHRASPISSSALERPPPTEFPDHQRATMTPGRHTTARAPVSRPPNSLRLTPPLPPLARRPWTPERPEAEAPVSPVPPSTASPSWTGVPVVHDPVDPVYGNFFMKIIC